jgi:hexosaminidase
VSRRTVSWLAAVAVAGLLPLAPCSAGVLPLPATSASLEGSFPVSAQTRVVVPPGDAGARAAARALIELLSVSTRQHLAILLSRGHPARAILFARQPGVAPEGYWLDIGSAGITITASTDAGLYYGALSLWQLVPSSGEHRTSAAQVRDQPAYPWRGLLLDSARHFQRPALIKRLIEVMALLKLNVLQWHLTDDQGWRLQIRRYPRLTSAGAFRVPAGRGAQSDIDPATHAPRLYGGFYSQAEVRDIVAYAAARHVLLVPEIDMPGHASAAIAAYPQLGTVPVEHVPSDWGIYEHVLNMSEGTCRFFENVLTEVIELFPGPYIHLGGDEVATHEWDQSAEAKARAAQLGLPGVSGFQRYLVNRMARFLAAHGRRLIGWDEIIGPGLGTDPVISSWRGLDGAVTAARRGNDTVLAPSPTLYFDYLQSDAPDEPTGRIKTTTLQDVYGFDPRPTGLTPAEMRHVLGVQGNVWTEHVRTEERLWHAVLPRAAAVAEIGWTPGAEREYGPFLERLQQLLPQLSELGVPFADSVFAVRLHRTRESPSRSMTSPASPPGQPAFRSRVELYTESGHGEIHYTLDGSQPQRASATYAGPLEVDEPAMIRAMSFARGKPLSAPRTYVLDSHTATRRSSSELKLCSTGLPLALEIDAPPQGERPIVRLDIMNPCWIWRAADLSHPQELEAEVGPVPFNYQLGADVGKIRVGDAHTPAGELEVRVDNCDGAAIVTVPLAAAALTGESRLRAALPVLPGTHDLCFRFARPALDPMWAVDWLALGE